MKEITDRVILFEHSDIRYPFEGKPSVYLGKHDGESYGRNEYVHYVPCYHHDPEIVKQELHRVESIFPVKWKPYLYIVPFDTDGRTNGSADKNCIWNDGEKNGEASPFRPYIMLWGKYIPLHPAMTRYLVAHEYGHVVNYWLEYKLGNKDESITEFDKMYAGIRNIGCSGEYSILSWHTNIGEIIANDIRICLFNSETEFWPHNVEHPLKCPDVIKFWNDMKEQHAFWGK